MNSWEVVDNGVTSEQIAELVPGLTVDPFSIRGTYILRQDEIHKPREINNRRIAARRRRQKIEREKAGLFATEVAAEQKDPEQELREMDARAFIRINAADAHTYNGWIKNLNRLAAKSPDDQSRLVSAWNAAAIPKDHAYFGDWLTNAERIGLASKVADRSSIHDPDKRSLVERMDKTWRTLKDIERSAKPGSPLNIAPMRLEEERAKYSALGVDPPSYESDKPTWEVLQRIKEEKRLTTQAETESRRAIEAKGLLFPVDELKAAVSQ
jgi:hypothetical protein